MSVTVDPPSVLPVTHLSVSSMKLYLECPLKWKRRYIDGEYEPANGRMILGSAAGAAEAQHYSEVIETGIGHSVEQVLDEFSSEFDDRLEREHVVFGMDSPGELKDTGAAALAQYHVRVAPSIVPVSVEREFRLFWPGIDWDVTGFIDLEDADGDIDDLKMTGKRIGKSKADTDLQPTTYLAARRAEGNPARRFNFHTMLRQAKPSAEVVCTERTDSQLDALTDRLFLVAREIAWRAENDAWQGASPGSWMCSPGYCGYWHRCEFGGAR